MSWNFFSCFEVPLTFGTHFVMLSRIVLSFYQLPYYLKLSLLCYNAVSGFLHLLPTFLQGKPWAEIVALRKHHLNPSLNSNLWYKEPLLFTQGHMQWLWDHKGKRYLDMFAGIVTVSVGHCHPWVKQATWLLPFWKSLLASAVIILKCTFSHVMRMLFQVLVFVI